MRGKQKPSKSFIFSLGENSNEAKDTKKKNIYNGANV